MSPRKKPGRPESVWGLIIADPWRKLGAIALAMVAFEYLDRRVNESSNSTLEIRLPGQGSTDSNHVRLDINPQEYTLGTDDVLDDSTGKTIETVAILLTGRKELISEMKGNLHFIYRPTPAQLKAAEEPGSLTFQMKDLVHSNLDLNDNLADLDAVVMEPATVRLQIRPNGRTIRQLIAANVSLQYGTSGLEKRLSNPSFSSPQVELRGPQKAINRIPKTGKEVFVGIVPSVTRDATTVRVDLKLSPAFKDITMSAAAFAEYQIEADWVSFEFENVPVEIDNKRLEGDQQKKDLFTVEPERLESVKLRVKGELATILTTLDQAAKRAFVRKHVRLVVYPRPEHLTKDAQSVKPRIEFVLLDDIPEPRRDKDYKVDNLEFVTLKLKQ